MSRRYYIVAMMMLVHNIAWTINTGMYFIPLNVGTGIYSQKGVISLPDDQETIWDTIKQYPGELGIHSDLIQDFKRSFQSTEVLFKTPKLVQMGIGYQFTSNFSVEFKPTALQPTSQILHTTTALKEKLKQKTLGEQWRYGFSLSAQVNVPLTYWLRLYGKAGKVLYLYESTPQEFDLNQFTNKALHTVRKPISEIFKIAPWFGSAGLYYQWSSNKLVDVSWECYPSAKPRGDFLHFIKLGMNIYL